MNKLTQFVAKLNKLEQKFDHLFIAISGSKAGNDEVEEVEPILNGEIDKEKWCNSTSPRVHRS